MIIKNNTVSDVRVDDLGQLMVKSNTSVDTMRMFKDYEISGSDDLKTLVTAGTLVLNDGSNDLSVAEAAKYLTPVTGYSIQRLVQTDPLTDGYVEVIRTNGLVSSIVTWDSSSKLKKTREEIYTRVGGLVTQVVCKQYNEQGVLLVTETHTITRTSGLVVSERVQVQ